MASPDPQDAAGSRRRTLIFTAVAGVLVAGLLFAIVSRVATTGGTARSSSVTGLAGQFEAGLASRLAPRVDRSGPFLFPDPQGRSRDIFVQHLGGDQWVAFEARVSGSPRNCNVSWEQDTRRFVDPCDHRTYPADGAGLVSFPTRVDAKGQVVVDLSHPTPPQPLAG